MMTHAYLYFFSTESYYNKMFHEEKNQCPIFGGTFLRKRYNHYYPQGFISDKKAALRKEDAA